MEDGVEVIFDKWDLKVGHDANAFMAIHGHGYQWSEDDFDAHKMMCYEGCLCMTPVLIQEQRFDPLGIALNRAYLIEKGDRSNGPATTTFTVFDADILLFLRGALVKDGAEYTSWWPRMIIYARRFAASGLFARSESQSFFSDWAPKIFGPISITEFQAKVSELTEQFRDGYYGYPGPNIVALTNIQHLGTRP